MIACRLNRGRYLQAPPNLCDIHGFQRGASGHRVEFVEPPERHALEKPLDAAGYQNLHEIDQEHDQRAGVAASKITMRDGRRRIVRGEPEPVGHADMIGMVPIEPDGLTCEVRRHGALAALDHVLVGLAVALPSDELIVRSAEAERILSERDGLSLGRDGRLTCRDPDQRREIDCAIHQAAATLRGAANCPESLHLIERRSAAHAYLVEVVPLADRDGEVESALEGALITIVDPDNVPPTSVTRFAQLHRLTPAETEVCALLVNGATREEIADHRGTSPETTKQQIKSLMRKCDARQRGQLIRLIFCTLLAVR